MAYDVNAVNYKTASSLLVEPPGKIPEIITKMSGIRNINVDDYDALEILDHNLSILCNRSCIISMKRKTIIMTFFFKHNGNKFDVHFLSYNSIIAMSLKP